MSWIDGEQVTGKHPNSYIARLNGRMDPDDEELAEVVDEETAELENGQLLRRSSGQEPTDMVSRRDMIQVEDRRKGKVLKVVERETYGITNYSIIFVEPEAEPRNGAEYARNQKLYANELVFQGTEDDEGRPVLEHLFEVNDFTVTVLDETPPNAQRDLGGYA